jgi:hypothetical protein
LHKKDGCPKCGSKAVRLFSFDDNQVKLFFKNYGLQNIGDGSINNSYEDILKISGILTQKKLGRPLFCWMLATVYNKSSEPGREILFDHSKNHELAEVLIYQRFIHNVVMGKPKDIAQRDYKEWFKRSRNEKKVLRLIAFLKNDKPSLSRNKIEDYLDPLNYVLATISKSLLPTRRIYYVLYLLYMR